MSGPDRVTANGPVVRYERFDAVAVITIDRPERGNSLGRAVWEELFAAWARFEGDPQARVAVLTGAGDRIFCAGADLVEMADEEMEIPPDDWAPILGQNITVTKPTIAAVNGAALGGGFLQMHMCDLAVAADNARIGITEARWGRGAPWALPLFRAIPTRILMELLLTARPIDARRAFEVGLVNRIVPAADLMPAALDLARSIAANAPLSLAAAKQMASIAASVVEPSRAAAQTREIWARVYHSEDAKIGSRAFRDGVVPVWTGR